MKIRLVQVEEAPRIAEIEQLQPFSAQWGLSGINNEFKNACAQIWGCEENGLLQGFLSFRSAGGEAEILNLAVHPSQCRKGFGFALLTKVLQVLKEQGTEMVTLEVNIRNQAAIHLYQKAGLTERGKRTRFYNQTDDALIMGKIL